MAKNSKIEWCDDTFNPWLGCTKVSPACDHCYTETWSKWSGNSTLWAGERRRTVPGNWRKPVKWNEHAAEAGVRRRVFCASHADVFDNQVPEVWRSDLFALIRVTPQLDWMLLTKRPQNIAKMLPPTWGDGWPNVWLGATVENQVEAQRRIPVLRAIPARVRFLSCEPLLMPLQLDLTGIHWVICGGESGHHTRLMEPAWAQQLLADAAAHGVAFFMKQMTRRAPIPLELMVRQFPLGVA